MHDGKFSIEQERKRGNKRERGKQERKFKERRGCKVLSSSPYPHVSTSEQGREGVGEERKNAESPPPLLTCARIERCHEKRVAAEATYE